MADCELGLKTQMVLASMDGDRKEQNRRLREGRKGEERHPPGLRQAGEAHINSSTSGRVAVHCTA
jgi:hypothetical protein